MGEHIAPPDFLIVGHILAPQGIKGEVKAQVVTDFPDRFAPGEFVYIDGRPLEVEGSRPHKQHLVLKLAAVDTRQDAEELRGRDLCIPRSEIRELPDGEFYAFQLIGLDVFTMEGNHVGRITDIMTTVGNDIYILQGERGEILIPAIEDVVKSIDLDKGRVTIEAIEGLLSSS
ncbi:MAG: 16S rRNA processing protein RimM [Dehalococcoidia bacterium]|nr:MAG: 16S rRNA processing protein RimM [Dehalococcoidia bacterium]